VSDDNGTTVVTGHAPCGPDTIIDDGPFIGGVGGGTPTPIGGGGSGPGGRGPTPVPCLAGAGPLVPGQSRCQQPPVPTTHDAVCKTLDNISKGSAIAADLTAVVGAGATASILFTGGTDSPIAGPVAAGSGLLIVGLKGIQYGNGMVANWGLGCKNAW